MFIGATAGANDFYHRSLRRQGRLMMSRSAGFEHELSQSVTRAADCKFKWQIGEIVDAARSLVDLQGACDDSVYVMRRARTERFPFQWPWV